MNEKFSAIVFMLLGIFLLVCFYLLKRKHKITILREFMYKNVPKKKAIKFCEEMSMVFFFLGIGTLLMGVSYFANLATMGAVVLVASIIMAAVTLKKMQVKYKFGRAKK